MATRRHLCFKWPGAALSVKLVDRLICPEASLNKRPPLVVKWENFSPISFHQRVFFTMRVVIDLPYRAHFFEANGSGPSHNLIYALFKRNLCASNVDPNLSSWTNNTDIIGIEHK